MQPESFAGMLWTLMPSLRLAVAKQKVHDSGVTEGGLLDRLTFMPLREFVEKPCDLGASAGDYEALESTTNVLSARKARKPEGDTTREAEDGTCDQGLNSKLALGIKLAEPKKISDTATVKKGQFVNVPVTKEQWTSRYGEPAEPTSTDDSGAVTPHPTFVALGSVAIGVYGTRYLVDAASAVNAEIVPVLLVPRTKKLEGLLTWLAHVQAEYKYDKSLFTSDAALRRVERLAIGFEFNRRALLTIELSRKLQAFLLDISENCNLSVRLVSADFRLS